MKEALEPEGKVVRTYFMDEARFGQQGTMTRVWAATGSRPRAVKQTRYEWVYLYAAVEPVTGASTALLLPEVNIAAFDVFLRQLAKDLQPNEHAIVFLDQAGWHTSPRVTLPENITLYFLPPCSPELNPVENLWHYKRSHHMSNRTFDDYEHVLDASSQSWRSLTKAILKSVCRCDYLTREVEL